MIEKSFCDQYCEKEGDTYANISTMTSDGSHGTQMHGMRALSAKVHFTRGEMAGKLKEERSLTSVAQEFGTVKSVFSKARETFQITGAA
ncbi:hypothetical protein TNCV_3803741 [Trichonephila clavipes]|nr:hypothetical protein TNCV_3803741 [Trichonephila clavipes]